MDVLAAIAKQSNDMKVAAALAQSQQEVKVRVVLQCDSWRRRKKGSYIKERCVVVVTGGSAHGAVMGIHEGRYQAHVEVTRDCHSPFLPPEGRGPDCCSGIQRDHLHGK